MVPLELFRSRAFSGANAITLLLYFAMSGAMFFLPFNLIRVQGYSATAGRGRVSAVHARHGCAVALVRRAGRPVRRASAARRSGPLIAAAGLALLALPGIGGSYWTTFFPAMLVLGLGMAVSVAPLTTTVMDAVAEQHAGAASGINNAVARMAGMLAVAVLGALAVGVFSRSLAGRLDALKVPASVREAALRQAPRLAEAKVPGLEAALAQAFVSSYRVVMLVAAGLAGLSAVCAWATIGDRTKRS